MPARDCILNFNRIFCQYWRHTPYKDNPLPQCVIQDNKNGTMSFFYKGVLQNKSKMYNVYQERLIDLNIDQIGLDLNDYKVALPLAGIIIAEISGEFDHEKAIVSFLHSF